MVWEKIIDTIKSRFTQMTAGEKKRLVLICTAGFAFLLTLSVFASMGGRTREEKRNAKTEQFSINVPIPAEELFLPEEPEFVPGVLLERERRETWTEEDASEFWQDPLRAGEEQWREKIETSINEMLERVP